jgi:uncharacterized membrane protein
VRRRRLLRALDAEGALSLYAVAVIVRPPTRGAGVVVGEPVHAGGGGAAAPSVGAAVGALVTLLGGPGTAAACTLEAGLAGAVRDLEEAGLDHRFLARVARHLRPGGGAVIAEEEEGERSRLEARFAELGGRVVRHRLAGALAGERLTRVAAALRD